MFGVGTRPSVRVGSAVTGLPRYGCDTGSLRTVPPLQPEDIESNPVILTPQAPLLEAFLLLAAATVSLRPLEDPLTLPRATPMKWRAPQALITQKSPGLLLSPPLNNATHGCLRAEVWSKQSLNYNKVSHYTTLIA